MNSFYHTWMFGLTPVPYTAEQLANFPHQTNARRIADRAFSEATQRGETLSQAEYDRIWDNAYQQSKVDMQLASIFGDWSMWR